MDQEIFAIYFPSWHPDHHYEKWYGKGFSEWELVKSTKPLFEGHYQPRRPLWGYFDESDPEMMARQIDAAADSGITGFLFDWYWYSGEQFLEKPLDEAFLNAPNRNRLKFALMWANHNWGMWPALDDDEHQAMNGNVNQSSNLYLKITHSEEDLRNVIDFCSEKYFSCDNYWKIDGKPVFSFFSSTKIFENLAPADVVRIMNEQARKNGFPGIYLLMNIGCNNDNKYFCGWGRVPLLREAGFDAVFAYNIVAPANYYELPQERPVFDYSGMMESQEYCWGKIEEGGLPHFPSVTLGLDVAPRWSRNVKFPMDYVALGYCPICTDITPERFGTVLEKALAKKAPAVIINAWNEWTEGMALIPDEKYGSGYLDTIREITGKILPPDAPRG
ncbi:MAG: glycoside hydrolase family 99-like domain-containing protein [Lentisphaeria bacterium]|nr:glycoside hydrolase family 99-like domain-containing protein [Lentisphaeria bacterium]